MVRVRSGNLPQPQRSFVYCIDTPIRRPRDPVSKESHQLFSPTHGIVPRTPPLPPLSPSAPAADSRSADKPAEVALETVNTVVVNDGLILRPPPEIYSTCVAVGINKASMSPLKTFILGSNAGSYIAMAALVNVTLFGQFGALTPALAKVSAALIFPFSVLLVLIMGGEMVTSNFMSVGAAFLEGKISKRQVVKNWTFAWLGNVFGSALVAGLCWAAGLFRVPGVGDFVKTLTIQKCITKTAVELVFQGALGNLFVCLAIYLTMCAKDPLTKMLYMWMPISALFTLGLEICVTDMFVIPAGVMVGAKLTFFQALKSLLWVTLGNMLGGLVLVAMVGHVLYGNKHIQ